jgi:hypothetical protein
MTEAVSDLTLEEGLQLGPAEFSVQSLLFSASRCLNELLGTAVAQVHAVLGAGPFRGLQITRQMSHVGSAERWGSRLDLPVASLAKIMSQAVTAELQDTVFRRLAETYPLTAFQAGVLIVAQAPEPDLKYERLCTYQQDDVGNKQPTADLILQLLSLVAQTRVKARADFAHGWETLWQHRGHLTCL